MKKERNTYGRGGGGVYGMILQKDASVVECVATCPIFCHTTITLHKMYLIILNIVGSVLMIVNNTVPTVPVDTGEL